MIDDEGDRAAALPSRPVRREYRERHAVCPARAGDSDFGAGLEGPQPIHQGGKFARVETGVPGSGLSATGGYPPHFDVLRSAANRRLTTSSALGKLR